MNNSSQPSSQCISQGTGQRTSKRSSQRGFTLVEAMVTLRLSAASLTAGVPMFKGVSEAMRLNSASEGYFHSLMLARSEAIERGPRVVVCKSADLHSSMSSKLR